MTKQPAPRQGPVEADAHFFSGRQRRQQHRPTVRPRPASSPTAGTSPHPASIHEPPFSPVQHIADRDSTNPRDVRRACEIPSDQWRPLTSPTGFAPPPQAKATVSDRPTGGRGAGSPRHVQTAVWREKAGKLLWCLQRRSFDMGSGVFGTVQLFCSVVVRKRVVEFWTTISRALTKKGAVGMLFTCIVLCLVSAASLPNKEPEHSFTVLSPKIDVKQISVDTFAPNTKPSKSLRNEMDHGWRADRKHVIIGCSKLVRTHTHTHTHTNTQTQQLRAINNHTTTELCLRPPVRPRAHTNQNIHRRSKTARPRIVLVQQPPSGRSPLDLLHPGGSDHQSQAAAVGRIRETWRDARAAHAQHSTTTHNTTAGPRASYSTAACQHIHNSEPVTRDPTKTQTPPPHCVKWQAPCKRHEDTKSATKADEPVTTWDFPLRAGVPMSCRQLGVTSSSTVAAMKL